MSIPRPQLPQEIPLADAVDRLCVNVIRRFNCAYPIPLAITRLDGRADAIRFDGAEIPTVHPTCQPCARRASCESEWRDTLAGSLEPKTGCCVAENLVSFVPVVRNGRPVAAFQMVEFPGLPKASFQHRIELIARLIEESEPESTSESETVRKQKATSAVGPWWRPTRDGMHPQIQRATAFIDQRLTNPQTNVASVARALGVNASYLSHIFSEEMGTRMSRYIASRRVQLAKKFLATTEWQVKQVAFESGHSNADWFSQVFHAYTGMTPCSYRRQARTNPSGAV